MTRPRRATGAAPARLPARGLPLFVGLGWALALLIGAVSDASANDPEPATAASSKGAATDEAPRARAAALFARAEQAALELRLADALGAYRAAIEADPSAPFVAVARARAEALAARSEGDFKPLKRLEEARRDPAKLAVRAELEAFERDIAAFPAGRVRSEARLVAAEAWRQKLGDGARAEALLEAAVADPSADLLLKSLALSELVLLQRERGDLPAAVAAVSAHPDVSPSLRADVLRAARRVSLRRASFAVLGGLGLVLAASIWKASRRAPLHKVWLAIRSPLAFAFALYIGGAAAILARVHDGADARPFLLLGLGVLGCFIVARAWSHVSTDRRLVARVGRAAVCAAGVLAAAFLALELTNAGYLEGVGL